MNKEAKIEVIGNYSPSRHDASRIVDENGIAPTVKELALLGLSLAHRPQQTENEILTLKNVPNT